MMPSTRPPATAKRSQLPALTGVRFFTAFHIVMFHHAEAALVAFPAWIRNILAGPGGVGLFFVLSGFILTYVYGHRFRNGSVGLARFLRARFARIYPTYLLGMLLVAPFFFGPFIAANGFVLGMAKSMVTVIPTLGLVHAWIPPIALTWNGPDWAVSAMFFYYLCFPFVLGVIADRKLRWLYAMVGAMVLLTILPAATVLKFPFPEVGFQEGWRVLPLTRLPEFLLGMGLGVIYLRRRDEPAEAGRGALLGTVGAIVALAVMAIFGLVPYWVYKPLLVAGFGLTIYGLAFGRGWLARALSLDWVVLAGHAGFPIYILSLPVWAWTTRAAEASGLLDTDSLLFFGVYSVVLIVFSILVLKLYEDPLRRVLRRRAAPASPNRDSAPVPSTSPTDTVVDPARSR